MPIEVKASQTWNSSFVKGIRYFQKLASERATKGIVVFGGEMKRATDQYQLVHYREVEQVVLNQANHSP